VIFAVSLTACRYTGFNDTAGRFSAAAGVNWLRTQQRTDGGFELAGFAGFETPDAILAIAENAQQQAAWDTTQARGAVQATVTNGNNPLHAIDNFVDGTINAGQAAKVIVLVAEPLGLSVTNFNPDGDTAKNLIATVNAGAASDGSYGAFNATLYAAMAKKLVDGAVPAKTLSLIRAAQEPFGGWDFNGEPTGNDADIDTTSIAIAALAAAGVPGNDPDVRAGLAYLAASQRSNGAFQAFGSDDPNSTSSAVFGIVAGGFDPTSSCWRDVVAPGLRGRPYTSPLVWLRSQQITAPGPSQGRIKSPNDQFGVNTFATSQTVQAMRRAWIPVSPLPPQQCP
jgi:hypothetical protein